MLDRAAATVVQVHSLNHRTRFAEGVGLESLHELGITIPAADRLAAEPEHQFRHLYQ